MDIIMYSLLITIAICMLLIGYVSVYNRFQDYIIRINEAESNIDTVLRKRFDLLDKSISVIKSVIGEDIDVLIIIDKVRSRKLTNFDLDRLLYQAINEFDIFKEKYSDLTLNENFLKVCNGINESEADMLAYRKYYNDIITDYNHLAKAFPSIVVAKLSGCKTRLYYDGKDMSDETNNDFKL